MKKNILLITFLISALSAFSQKSQKIAYIDMEYILQNIPEYSEAEKHLEEKVLIWKNKLRKEKEEIEVQKNNLLNEKAILTKDLIEQFEEDIKIRQQEYNKLEESYFGTNGDLYTLKKQLIQPIQDKVYNAVQTIVKHKKYDFVFNKSSDLIMLYSNKKYDISDIIVKLIKIESKKDKKSNIIAERKKLLGKESLTDNQKEVIVKKEEKKSRLAKQKEEHNKKIRERRQKLREKRELLLKTKIKKQSKINLKQ